MNRSLRVLARRTLPAGVIAIASVLAFADRARGEPEAANPAPAPALGAGERATLAALHDEVQRARRSLRLPSFPEPHYVSATLFDHDIVAVEATLGKLLATNQRKNRTIQAVVRVGDARFDSSNFLGNDAPVQVSQAPIENDYAALRRELWLTLDAAFKGAASTFEAKRGQRASQAGQVDAPPDFTAAPQTHALLPSTLPPLRNEAYVDLARKVSAVLREYSELHDSSVAIMAGTERRYFVTSEGTEVIEPSEIVELVITARTQAEDGMPLAHFTTVAAANLGKLPPEERLVAEARRVAEELTQLRSAPVIEDYGGPVLLEGMAAPQLLRVLLAEEFSGTPAPEAPGGMMTEASSLAARIGWRVLPAGVDVIDDPTLGILDEAPLIGRFRYDDEGVPGQRVELVKDGKLSTLLMSRTPSRRLSGSNGHARSGNSGWARARASNLLVTSRQGLAAPALRARLMQSVRAEKLPFGIVVRQLDEPRLTANVLELDRVPSPTGPILPRPILMYRVYPDGREELVRGATLQSLQVRDLRYLVALGNKPTVFSFFAPSNPMAISGAFAGDIATSIAAPSLLVRDLDVRRPIAPHRRPPTLPRPRL